MVPEVLGAEKPPLSLKSLRSTISKILLYTHQCSQSWYCRLHRVWSDAPDTTLWFSESISPLSETDDVVHNVFLNTNAWGIVTSFISSRTKYVQSTLSVSKWSLHIILLSINASFWCILNDFQLITLLRGYSTQEKIITMVVFKMCFSLVNEHWTVDPRYLFRSFSITLEGYIINLSL